MGKGIREKKGIKNSEDNRKSSIDMFPILEKTEKRELRI